jgi:hypothetical protein
MNSEQIVWYKDGYRECREVIIHRLKALIYPSVDPVKAVESLLASLIQESNDDRWAEIQNEFPSITKEQYLALWNQDLDHIKKKYYDSNGNLKRFTTVE